MDSISSKVDILNSKTIVEDFFWTNPERFAAEKVGCFDIIEVDANETFDFSANLSLVWGPSGDHGYFYAYLEKDGVEVARSVDDRGLPVNYW